MRHRVFFTLIALVILPACQTLAQNEAGPPVIAVTDSVTIVTASITGKAGDEIGQVRLIEGPNGVILRAEFAATALPSGWHGLHLHQVGDCTDLGVFKRSGGHVGKIEGGHGLLNPKGPESGDMPNLYIGPDGGGAMEALLLIESVNTLLDADGSALIVHEKADDHITQPIGGAGARIACAVIQAP